MQQHNLPPRVACLAHGFASGLSVLLVSILTTLPCFALAETGVVSREISRDAGSTAAGSGDGGVKANRRLRFLAKNTAGVPGREALGGTPEFEPDGTGPLSINPYEEQSMATHFRVLDDLEPVAPMDSVAWGGGVSGPVVEQHFSAHGMKDAVYVPPYLRPDAFPTIFGEHCDCGKSQEGLDFVNCTCTGGDGLESAKFRRMIPVYNSSDFKLVPADMTYSGGDYFGPHIHDSLAAPHDRLPIADYPLQARADAVNLVPAAAREDRISTKFARYIDQVEKRSRDCDNVSPECTVPCKAGDNVILTVGNMFGNATVVSAHVGNALTVKTVTSDSSDGVPCAANVGCTIFRPCLAQGMPCFEKQPTMYKDFMGNLRTGNSVCPEGTKPCSSIEQMVSATFATKGGKACQAAPPAA
eukprot:TRINITY_DN76000_c0_g1_i1.p1 TRINITY_DN76000_c0_g1~~TRINITY_DN76000_c0_g1_i1.p1  ORF type:complete len:413 (+),score=51.23 TRINITY_DN76000_c0_g1_i1:71-1309(+)